MSNRPATALSLAQAVLLPALPSDGFGLAVGAPAEGGREPTEIEKPASRGVKRVAEIRAITYGPHSMPWTASPVEGPIGRIKMLKRTMYGRSGFELLRARVLHAA